MTVSSVRLYSWSIENCQATVISLPLVPQTDAYIPYHDPAKENVLLNDPNLHEDAYDSLKQNTATCDTIKKITINLPQIILKGLTIGATSAFAHRNTKVATFATLFQLLPFLNGLSIGFEIESSHNKIDTLARSLLQSSPITILTPLPDLSLQVGAFLNLPINIKDYCKLSDPSRYIELSIQQSDGSPAPNWISLNFGELSLDATIGGGTGSYIQQIELSVNYLYTVLNNQQIAVYNVTNPSNPTFAGNSLTASVGVIQDFYVKGNYAFVPINNFPTSSSLEVYEISDFSNPNLINNINFDPITFNGAMFIGNGNSFYFSNTDDVVAIDVTDPLNLSVKNVYTYNSFNPGAPFTVNDSYCFIADFNTINIVNVSNISNPVIVSQIPCPDYSISIYVHNNYLFRATTNQALHIYDISQIASPVMVKSIPLGMSPRSLSVKENEVYVIGEAGIYGGYSILKVIDITDLSKAKVVSTFDTFGHSSIGGGNELAWIGNELYLTDGEDGVMLFDTGKRALSGTPSANDRGLLLLDVIIQDDANNILVDPISIHVGDINVVTPISNQQVYVGNATLFTFSEEIFEYPNANFTYSANLVGGLPLPSFISFDPLSRTFLFAPQAGDQNTYRIEVTANDGYGGIKPTTFDLMVPNRPTVLAQPLTDQVAYSGILFEFIFASDAFNDPDDNLSYSTHLVGRDYLPSWLSFDATMRRFYGIPFGSGTYPIEIIASDGHGGTLSDIFTISVPNSAPVLLNPIGAQQVAIGLPFSFTFNSNTFFDIDHNPLTYSVDPLPSFVTFNNATRTFTGTPSAQDLGSYSIVLRAQDPLGETVAHTFSMTVLGSVNNMPPVLILEIPDFSVKANIPFNYTFDAGTFEDPEGQALIYTATLEGGDPLPTGLYFDSDTRTLSGVINQPQTYRVTIRAIDTLGAFALNTFTLTVKDDANYPPIVLQPLPDETATVGAMFTKQVPHNTFEDVDGDSLTITVSLSDGSPIPKWLKWYPETLSFSGKPGPFDTGTYVNKEYTINVRASDGIGSTIASFKLTVQGESFWETFIKFGVSFGSAIISGVGLWEARALIWNHFNNKYKKATETALVNKLYERAIDLQESDVKAVRAFRNDLPLHQGMYLPEGLNYEGNKLVGTPSSDSVGRYTIRVIDHIGYIHEEFELLIKNHYDDDLDPEDHKSCFNKTKPNRSIVMRNLNKSLIDEAV